MEYVVFALWAVSAVLYIVAMVFSARHFIHMFQLNSYKPKVHLKWLWANERKYFVFGIVSSALAFVITSITMILIVLIDRLTDTAVTTFFFVYVWLIIPIILVAFSVTVIITKRPKKSYKTPIVYTARIKRLIATLVVVHILLVLMIALPIFSDFEMIVYILFWVVTPAFPVITLALLPLTILLANLINRPLELAINKHYINDAKKILSGCRNLTVIGITGSFGKTSVKYFLDTLLSVKFNVLKTPGNFNTPLGVVKTIRGSLRATHDIFLCEMGAKNVGDIKEICDIVHPKHGIITSVGPMHLESFKSLENVKKTKFELADALPQDGMLFLNMDNENICDMASGRSFIAYGIDNKSGYYVSDLHISEKGSEFRITAPNGASCDYRTKLIGRHNVLNIAGAVAVANKMGIGLDELRAAVRKLESVPHRLELINKGAYTVIDDAYNSNPSGTKAALEALSMTDGYKILVTPGMVELGEMENELNREFGENAAKVCDYVALVGKKQTEAIYEGLISAGFDKSKIYVAESLNDAMANVYGLTTDGKRKIILLENDLPDNY